MRERGETMLWRKRLACSFCGRGAEEVTKLVAGPRVNICDRCVAVAQRMMKSDGGSPNSAPVAPEGPVSRAFARVLRIVRGLGQGSSSHHVIAR